MRLGSQLLLSAQMESVLEATVILGDPSQTVWTNHFGLSNDSQGDRRGIRRLTQIMSDHF